MSEKFHRKISLLISSVSARVSPIAEPEHHSTTRGRTRFGATQRPSSARG
jgi:hypothetical protein